MLQLNAGAGPCAQSFETGKPVSLADVSRAPERWSQFQAAALLQEFHSVHAVPLRLRSDVIGAMGLFRRGTGELNAADASVAQALADVATIGILQERLLRETGLVTDTGRRPAETRRTDRALQSSEYASLALGQLDAKRPR